MIRKLLIVFASGLVLSVVLLSAAWVVGGREAMAGFTREAWGSYWIFDPDFADDDGPRSTRSLAFDGSKVLTIDAAATVRFTRGPQSSIRVEGPARVIERLRWEDGHLSLGRRWIGGPIDVTITAPQLAGLVLRGAGDATLTDLDQPALSVESFGAVDVDATGKVQTLTVTSHGAGDLDFGKVDTRDATLRIAGVGSVDVSASGKVDARISGAGDIALHRKPAQLITDIDGFGSVEHAYE